MKKISGSNALVELLLQNGVDTLFGNPGSTELPLMDALAGYPGMRFVLGLQESIVMAMADGYSQATGKLSAINLHAAPGLGNALGMLYNAKKSGAPVIVTAGQQAQRICLTEPLLWDDLPTMARPLVKWSTEVQCTADLPRAIHRAAKVALTPPTGPVFLSLPSNVLTDSAELDLRSPTRIAHQWPADPAAIAQAAELMLAAHSPVLFAGDCVAQGDALAELVELVELLGVPVYLEGMANTASFPASHPSFAGALPRLAGPMREALAKHDLIVSIGADLVTQSLPGNSEPIPPDVKIVHLDTDAWELGKNFPAAAALLGHPKPSLAALIAVLRQRTTGQKAEELRARRVTVERGNAAALARLRAQAANESKLESIKPLALLAAIGHALPAEAVVVEELLSSANGVRNFLKSNDRQSFYGMRGGGIGCGLPWAVGIKLGIPDRPVVSLVGDGSAMYSIQALWTAAHEKLPATFVIFNNRSYRILKQRTVALKGNTAASGRFIGMDLVDPPIDFVGLASSLGVNAVRTGTIAGAIEAIQNSLKSVAPNLVEVQIDGAL